MGFSNVTDSRDFVSGRFVTSDGQRWVNFFSRLRNIRPPMMLIDGIFLVQVDLEELVMSVALEVLVSSPGSRPSRRRRAETLSEDILSIATVS
jgi:hypothetical protein